MPQFIPGVRLNEMFYRKAVAPILASAFPGLRYSAALIGYGSDVLGFDSERSTDHEWGPRLVIFVSEKDRDALVPSIDEILATRLPREFHGYSTNFSEPDEERVRILEPAKSDRIKHHVYFHTFPEFIRRPYRVLWAGRFAKAVSDEIKNEQLRNIYDTAGPIGSIDQFGDSTNLLMRSDLRTRLRVLYETPAS